MHTVLSATLGSNGTFLNLPSTSMAFLHSVGASALCWPVMVLYHSSSSRRKCTFLWPGANPFSMFLASYWLPKKDITLKVAGILREK
jgi:hypothetical protein